MSQIYLKYKSLPINCLNVLNRVTKLQEHFHLIQKLNFYAL